MLRLRLLRPSWSLSWSALYLPEPPVLKDDNVWQNQDVNIPCQSRRVYCCDSALPEPKANHAGSDIVDGRSTAATSNDDNGSRNEAVDESEPALRTTAEHGNSGRSQRRLSEDEERHGPSTENHGFSASSCPSITTPVASNRVLFCGYGSW
ncbi:hypothetical protein CDD83_6456 [Cordyceps sp. RAO-2017]|nr:hypothetical protein CDD83_6456 [Cordyceps sp. RAO-2017]